MKKGTAKRVLALLICAVMAVSMLPTVAMAEEITNNTADDSAIEAYTAYENDSDVAVLDDEDDSGSSGIPIEDEKPNTDIKIIPSDANALILMDTGAQSPRGVPGQVVKIVLPLAVNKEYLPSEKYMLRNINIYPDVPTDTSVSNWPFELIYASDVQHLKDMSYNSTAEVWYEFKISEFASKGRYAVPFKVNVTVWREDAVNGTTITEDVTFKITAYVTVTDDGNMSGVTTSFGSLQVAGTNVDGSYTVPTGTPNQTISMRIPVINVGGTLTGVTITPVVSTSLDEFPFVVTSTNYSQYFSYWASGEIKYLDYTFTVSPFATSGNKSIKFKATYFENSAPAEGSFSTQITIIDGYDASAMAVMVQSYKLYVDDTEVSGLMAGEETELRLTVINNSKVDTAKKVIGSLVFTNSPGLTLAMGGTDTAYADTIKPGGTATLKYKIMAKQDAEVGPTMLGINLTYETTEAIAGKAAQNIMLPVSQQMDILTGTPEVYGTPSKDKEATISVPLTNMGRAKALNIRVMATDGMTSPTPCYVGDLQAAEVVITTNGAVPTVAGATAKSVSSNAYTYELNLLNTRYAVTVGSNTYYLAAGFEKNIALSTNDVDPLAITVTKLGSTTAGIKVYGSVVQNNYMGNTYYVNNGTNWTDTNVAYYISGTYTWLGDSTIVTANISKNAAATLGGNYSTNGTIDLTVDRPTVTVTYNGQTRSYFVNAVLDTTTSFRVSASTYAINFDELNNSEYADEFETNVAQIESALNAYYAKGKVFAATDSVMDVMKDFISFAQSTYFSGTTNCSDTYLATLNGLGEFSAGQMSGWCYMDGAYTPTCKVPMIGAADYPLGNAALFTWFLTVDYTPHF